MLRPGQPDLHVSTIKLSVGLVCALCNTLPLYLCASQLGIGLSSLQWVYLVVGAVAFFAFTGFRQIVSARHVWWMLRAGILRWLRVLFVVVLSVVFLKDQTIDVYQARKLILWWCAATLPLLMVCLAFGRRAIYRFNNLPSNRRKAVFFGFGPLASVLYKRLRRSPILGIEVVGYYAAEPVSRASRDDELPPYLGPHEAAWPRIHASEFDMVIVQPEGYYDQPLSQQLFNALNDSTAAIYMAPETRWTTDVTQAGAELAGIPLLAIHDTPIMGMARVFKRAFDLVIAGLAVLVLSPVMLAVAIAIRLDSPGPILFRQARYGARGQPINVFKFRSMYVGEPRADVPQATRDDPRVTRVGAFIRRTSLDELPQLFNVLGGSMSLVGPRPHAVAHNEAYRHQIIGYMLRHSIKPGITGWAQVNGLRGETDTVDKMQRRIEYDRYYIKHWSIGFDIRILLKTVWTVFRGNNAY